MCLVLPIIMIMGVFFVDETIYTSSYANDVVSKEFSNQVTLFNEWMDNKVEFAKLYTLLIANDLQNDEENSRSVEY